jgi:hypothetical protein
MGFFVIIEYPKHVLTGGLGDKIVGLVSAMCIARVLGRKLLVKWDYPSINGIIDLGSHNFYHYNPSLHGVIELDTIDNRFKYQQLLTQQPLQHLWKNKNILLRCNQELGFFVYHNPHVSKGRNYVHEMLDCYKQVFTTILRPIGPNTIHVPKPYIGIQLRCGDKYMGVGGHQPVSNLNQVLYPLSTYLKTHFQFIPYIYLTTDHPHAKQELQQLLNSSSFTLYDTPASRIHFERTHTHPQQLKPLLDDLLTLIHAEYLIISAYSNYGRIAALISGQTNILGFNPPNFDIHPIPLEQLFTKHISNPHSTSPVERNHKATTKRIVRKKQPLLRIPMKKKQQLIRKRKTMTQRPIRKKQPLGRKRFQRSVIRNKRSAYRRRTFTRGNIRFTRRRMNRRFNYRKRNRHMNNNKKGVRNIFIRHG